MKTINVYAHKLGPVSRAFLQVVGIFDVTFIEVGDEKSADLILLTGPEDLRVLHNKQQMFCVLVGPTDRIAAAQPENVCVINVLRIFDGEKGCEELLKMVDRYQPSAERLAVAPTPPPPVFSDIPTFRKSYSVLVIDDTEQNRLIASAVLGGKHSLTVVSSLQEAMLKVRQESFDAVLTDMEMPPDKTYSALNVTANYGTGQTVPYGFAVILEMTGRGIPVAVVTDGNHHQGWVSAMFDHIKSADVNGQKVLFFNDIGKRWDHALKQLMEP